MRYAIPILLLLSACNLTNPPVCDSEFHSWGDERGAYHLRHDSLSPVVVNSSSYELDLEAWNALNSPITLRSSGEGFPIVVKDGGDADSGWLGLASVRLDGDGHIQSGLVQMNASILGRPRYDERPNVAAHVLCQELGHILGLDHDRTTRASCMNDCAGDSDWLGCLDDPAGVTPGPHDGVQLSEQYAHAVDDPVPSAPRCVGSIILDTFYPPGHGDHGGDDGGNH